MKRDKKSIQKVYIKKNLMRIISLFWFNQGNMKMERTHKKTKTKIVLFSYGRFDLVC